LVGREPVGQPALDLATRLIAGLDAEPLERAGRWDDDPAPPEDYLAAERNRQRHVAELQDRLGFRPFGTRPAADLAGWLLPHAIENDRLVHLAGLVVEKCCQVTNRRMLMVEGPLIFAPRLIQAPPAVASNQRAFIQQLSRSAMPAGAPPDTTGRRSS
jgi:hypothetical protein